MYMCILGQQKLKVQLVFRSPPTSLSYLSYFTSRNLHQLGGEIPLFQLGKTAVSHSSPVCTSTTWGTSAMTCSNNSLSPLVKTLQIHPFPSQKLHIYLCVEPTPLKNMNSSVADYSYIFPRYGTIKSYKIHVPVTTRCGLPRTPSPGLRVLSQRPALRGRVRQLQARQAAGRHLDFGAVVVSSMERLGFNSDL